MSITNSTDIFLSYSRDDQTTARRFAEGFERAGFSVWWDVTLKSGADYDKVTEDALRSAKAVVVLWSKKSVESRWVRAEATEAASLGTLVPVMIESCKRPIMFELKQSAELAHWKGDAQDAVWQTLVNDVRGFVAGGSQGADSSTLTPRSVFSGSTSPHQRRSLGKPVAAIAAVAVAVAVYFAVQHFSGANSASVASATSVIGTQAPAPIQALSIAVLPFRDQSPTADKSWLADGLSDEISNLLTRVNELLVINTNSSFHFRGQEQNFQTIRDTLKVAYLLSGSISTAGDELRISVQLTRTDNGSQLWSTNYVRQLKDVFDVQQEIAGAVTEALQIKLGTSKFGRTPGMTRNVEAWEYYVNARRALYSANAVEIRTTIEDLEKALILDPGFSFASVALYSLYTTGVPFLARSGDFPEQQSRAAEALNHIRTVNPEDPFLLVFDAINKSQQHNWVASEKSLDAVVEKSAKLQGTLVYSLTLVKAGFLTEVGRESESISMWERAKAADPLDDGIYISLSEALASQHELQRALDVDAAGLALPGEASNARLRGNRLIMLLALGDVNQIRNYRDSVPTTEDRSDLNLQMVDNLDNPAAALQILHKKAENPALSAQAVGVYSVWAAYFKDTAFSLELLNRRARLGNTTFTAALFRPIYAEVRKQPGFKNLVKQLGLVDYWRTTGKWGDFCHPVPDTENDFECK